MEKRQGRPAHHWQPSDLCSTHRPAPSHSPAALGLLGRRQPRPHGQLRGQQVQREGAAAEYQEQAEQRAHAAAGPESALPAWQR